MYLKSIKLDLDNGEDFYVLLNCADATAEGVNDGDLIEIGWSDVVLNVHAAITDTEVPVGSLGLFTDIWNKYELPNGTDIHLRLISPSQAIDAIKRKMLGHKLTKEELTGIMKDMGSRKLGIVETAYFMSTFFNPGFDEQEVLWMTEGMAHSGLVLSFNNIRGNGDVVVDKHSIGGVAGKGVTPIVVPIIAASGLVIPNTSTRAITAPAGTSDILETVMPVGLSNEEIMNTVKQTGACLVWGGGLDLAPADDVLIHVERVIHMESFQKVIVSIVAKKIAMGLTHVIIDLPYGKGTKVQNPDDVEMIEKGFKKLFEAVGIKAIFFKRSINNPDGNGVGPNLEMIEVLKVLNRASNKSEYLEDMSLEMAGRLFELVGKAATGKGKDMARQILDSGEAKKKFWEIAKAQGATKETEVSEIKVGDYKYDVIAQKAGKIKFINNREIKILSKILGTPIIKEAGLLFHKLSGDTLEKGETIFSMYSNSQRRINNAIESLDLDSLLEIA